MFGHTVLRTIAQNDSRSCSGNVLVRTGFGILLAKGGTVRAKKGASRASDLVCTAGWSVPSEEPRLSTTYYRGARAL